ncbi:MAG: hypothetical protein IGS49_05425 [Chlorogloeopsis fritschii C42_A2020_084]|uniref:hypothetical protein n=1 Tax=Chlorogloeopsis fritschii TaxID=1124 RepID=UPI0019DE1878|nr:hypothetical protein [Chlorogloeopsis fritschii]MBF2004905.1 hypothetical protein [Chlorogloeopsis fritschii C42_A2020_084]
MISSESNNSNTVEVDGIQFETMMPERVVQIPPKLPDAKTQVQFGIRVTNNTATPHRFILFSARPQFLQANKQEVLPFRVNAYRTEPSELSDFQLIVPGESVDFWLEGYFHWFKNELNFSFLRKDASYWWFSQFKSDTYFIQIYYANLYPDWEEMGFAGEIIYLKPMYKQQNYNYPKSDMIKIKDVWIGEVYTPPIKFSLIH